MERSRRLPAVICAALLAVTGVACDNEDVKDVQEGVNEVQREAEKAGEQAEQQIDQDVDTDGKDD